VISRSEGFDITRPETIATVFQEANTVFHLAALVQSRPGPFEQVNQSGLQNVIEASLRSGVDRFVYVSSFTVFGSSDDTQHNETALTERSSFFHGYDRSKFEALKIIKKWRSRIPLNIVYPTVVFGPGPLTEGNLMVHLFARWLKYRIAPLPGRGRPLWNFVFVEDVARGLIKVAEGREGEDYILGGSNVSLNELAGTLRQVSNRRFYSFGLSDQLFRLSCYAEDWASRAIGFRALALPQTGRFLLNNWQFSSAKAKMELGYAPRSLQEGLDQTYRWMKTTGIV
jgi:farnesol dehydrogenase